MGVGSRRLSCSSHEHTGMILPNTVYDSPEKRSLLLLPEPGRQDTDVLLGDGVPLL